MPKNIIIIKAWISRNIIIDKEHTGWVRVRLGERRGDGVSMDGLKY